MSIKVRITALGKKQVDLLAELRKRGYPKLQASQLSAYISGNLTGPQAENVLKIVDDILTEWEGEEE